MRLFSCCLFNEWFYAALQLIAFKATRHMVIDHAHRLHVGVAGGRAHEFKAAFF